MRQLHFEDSTLIKLSSHGDLSIESTQENVTYHQEGKPCFKNEATGEAVIEYSGLATDKREDRSWARAFYNTKGFSPLHYHSERTEIYYVIKGHAKVTLEGKSHFLLPGQHLVIHPKQKHKVVSVDEKDNLEIIVRCSPAWILSDQHSCET